MQPWELVFRLVLAALIGGLVGMEREANNRPAGLRTHVLVTIGSALIMLVSKHGFIDLASQGSLGDPSRLAAQVVSGIGFLGAGTILQTENKIKGLTTAASLWVCAGIGLAMGAGFYLGGLTTVVIVMVTLRALGYLEKKVFRKNFGTLYITFLERPGVIGDIGQILGKNNISIKDIKLSGDETDSDGDENKITEATFMLKLPEEYSDEKFFNEILDVPSLVSARWEDGKKRFSSRVSLQ